MYPCSLRIRASSRLSREDCIVTSWCCALAALRSRVRKSAIGSVIDMALPARLRHPGDVSVVRELAQADPAYAELAVHGASAAAALAAAVPAGLVLGCPPLADSLRNLGHELLTPPPGGPLSRMAFRSRRAARMPPHRSMRSL